MCVYARYCEDRLDIENKGKYYDFVKDEGYCLKVLKEFGLDGEYSTIINGHVPVKVKDGERADSGKCRHITIDGGFAKAYHEKTGIGGYTLIHNSQGLFLVSHSPDFSKEEAENGEAELQSTVRTLKLYRSRVLVKQTDKGRAIQKQIEVLKEMLHEYYRV